jgi:hypothetical protein
MVIEICLSGAGGFELAVGATLASPKSSSLACPPYCKDESFPFNLKDGFWRLG